MENIDTRRAFSCFFKRRAVLSFVGFLALFAQMGRAADALNYTKNYFVTGDYVVGGVGLRGTGATSGPDAGFATGSISISGVPSGGDVVAAFLYWETLETTPSASPSAVNGFFDGNAIVGIVRAESATPANLACGPSGSKGRVYRADVLKYLPVDHTNNVRIANGLHVVKLKDSGPAGVAPLTNGATLVVVYRLPYLGASPLRAVVIYDGAYTLTSTTPAMTQTIGGFYQASASPTAKMTQIVANGQSGFTEALSVNGGALSASPFTGAVGARWDNPTFSISLAQNSASFDTQVTTSASSVCVTWSAIIASTNVTDSDSDGLLDVWETSGLHLNPGDTTHPATFGSCSSYPAEPCVNLPAMGANAAQKDIFLEIDWLHGTSGGDHAHVPKLDALNALGATFLTHGIHMHFDVGNNYQSPASPYIIPTAYSNGGEVVEESTLLCPNAVTTTCAFSEPYAVLSWKVGFHAVKDGLSALSIPQHFAHNRKDIFHYVLFGHALAGPFDASTGRPLTQHPSSVSGVADRGGDIMITLGLWRSDVPADDQTGSILVQAGTLMHELGHNLNLSHAGLFRSPNCEPNYPSVMNYLYQTRGLTDASGLPHIDYSYGLLNALNENFLSETANMADPVSNLAYRTRYYGPALVGGHATAHCDGSPITDGALYARLETPGLVTPDWNSNGLVDGDIPLDVNFSGSIGDGVFGSNIFLDSNDWANVNLQQIGARANVNGLSGDVGQSDFGQSDFGQSDFGQSDFGQSDFGQSDFGQSDFGQSDFGGKSEVTYEAAETSSAAAVDPAHPLTAALHGTAGGPDGITLSWGAPTGMAQIRGYNIYRTTAIGVLPTKIGDVDGTPPVTTFTDLVDGTQTLYNTNYIYLITSVNVAAADGTITESGLSNSASGIVKHLFIKANDKNRVYGDPNPVFDAGAATGLDPGVTGTTTCGTSTPLNAKVGLYATITCSGLTPASGVTYLAGNLNITKAPLSIAVVTNSKPYDGGVTASAAPQASGLKFSDSVTGLAEVYSDKNAGTNKTLSVSAYTVNDGNSGGNYDVTPHSNNIGTIIKANATISVQPYSVIFDNTVHTATGTAMGVLNENLSGLDLSHTAHTAVGTYNADFWSFTDPAGNYNSVPNTTITDTIITGNTWPNGYGYRGTITVQHGKVPNADQSNFPVLFSGMFADLATTSHGGRVTNANGYDIIFTADAGGSVPLNYERASYSGANGQVMFWVRVPVLSHTTDTVFYVFYGKSSVTTDQSNKSGTWDSSFKGVWHMDDNAANTSVAASMGPNATNGANTSGKTAPGQFVSALNYNGSSDKTTTTLTRTSAFTWEVWFKATAFTPYESLLTIDGNNYVLMDVTSGGAASFWSVDGMAGNPLGVGGMVPGAWYHLVLTRSGDSATNGYTAYLNGVQKWQTNTGVLNSGNTVTFGFRPDSPSQGFNGALDEIRISNVARSADWIAAEYNNGLPGFYSTDLGHTNEGPPNPTTTTLTTTAPDPVPFGQNVPLSAQVTGPATGTVTFTDGTTDIATVALSGGVATFAATNLAAGPHTFIATYSGDSENSPSTSNSLARTVSPPAGSSWPNGYGFRGTITVQHGKVPNTDQTNFPVLVSVTNADLATTDHGGKVTNANGYDIVFASNPDGSGPLNYERESWSGLNGQAVFWVRVPALSHSTDTVIYVFYGNSSVTTDLSNRIGTWDSNYRGVWHMDDNAATTTVVGATGVNSTNAANTNGKAVAGEVVGALNYNGSSDRTSTNLNRTPALTWEVWFKASAINSYHSLLTIDGANYLLMDIAAGGVGSFWSADGLSNSTMGISGLTAGTWYHLVLTRSGDNTVNGYSVYLNGVLKGRANTGVLNNGNLITFGFRPDFASQGFNGALDEIRVSNIARSADWIATEDNNYIPGFYSAAWGQTP